MEDFFSFFLPEIFLVMVEAKWPFSQFHYFFDSHEWHHLLRKRCSFLINDLTYISVDSLIIVFSSELSYITIVVYFDAQIVLNLDSGHSFVLAHISL